MSLLKKISKGIAICVLGLGLAYPVFADATTDATTNSKINTRTEKERIEIEKEAEKYGRMEIIQESIRASYLNLMWDINKDNKNDLKANYDMFIDNDTYILKLSKIAEDKNKNEIFEKNEWVEYNREYNKFFLIPIQEGFLLCKDENGDDYIDKIYGYKRTKDLNDSPSKLREYFFHCQYKLWEISKDKDYNHKFEDNEVIWEAKEE